MTKYLLDSNILAYLEDKNSPFHPHVINRLTSLSDDDKVSVSVLSLCEFQSGIDADDVTKSEMLLTLIDSISRRFPVLDLTSKAVDSFGKLKNALQKKKGLNRKAIGQYSIDLLIASTAIGEGAVLVSNDRIFDELSGLHNDFKHENWAAK
jgi:predicted nucleic acid-binding protein